MEELEKIMLDYITWIFNLDFCTSRYLIMRELRMDKLRVGWSIRTRRYEVKVEMGMIGRIAKKSDKKNNNIDGGIVMGGVERSITIGMVEERMLGK